MGITLLIRVRDLGCGNRLVGKTNDEKTDCVLACIGTFTPRPGVQFVGKFVIWY